jgi:hypothetical protein
MVPRRALSFVAAGLLALGLWAGALQPQQAAQAQEFGRISETESTVAYFYHARPGEATVQVSLWGTVPSPGIYEVPDTTELDKLLTMAGGAPLEPTVEGRDEPTITVRVYRPEGGGDRALLFESDLQPMLNGEVAYPDLRDDDIVVVDTVRPRDPFSFRDALSVTSTLGTLLLLGLRIFDRT